MTAYSIFKHLHSGFRYIVFILLLLAIIQSLLGWINRKPYTEINRKLNLFTLISAHIQLLIGLVLFFISPYVQFTADTMKNDTTRYYTVEHWVMMLIAIVMITIGYSKSKKIVMPESKHRVVAIFYLIALSIIIGAILVGNRPLLGS
jgi:cytochrome b561